MRLLRSLFHYLKKHRWITIGILIILLISVFIFRPKPPKPVPTLTVKRSNLIQSVSVSGKVAAKNIADLSFLSGGKLTYLGVKVGDSVTQYQTIAMLDSRTTQKNIQSALIDYAKQRNTFDQTLDNNQNRKPDQALNDQMKRILQNNQNDLDKSINSLELQSLAQENSVLTSPIAGIVTRADAKNAGVNVAPTAVFEVVDPNSLVFNMDVDEADIGKITVGQQANVILDAYSSDTVKVSVTSIDFVSHTTTNGGDAFTVQTLLNDPSALKYRIGMNGNAEIVTKEKDDIITVPLSSVQDEKYVYVKTDNHFIKQPVKLGLQSDTNAEVLSGLQDGDVIAADPTAAAGQTK